jgi:molybdenum cofactor cytidylyltransferase
MVLAAGRSERMGACNKLLAPIDACPMVCRVVDRTLASRARPVVIVTGCEADRVREALGDRAVEYAHNADFAAGLGASLRVGVAALADRVDGALVCLGDMPWVRAAELDALIDAHAASGGRAICVPRFAGRRGNPVLWPATRFPELLALRGDEGARTLLEARPSELCYVPVSHDGVLRDVDTPEALSEGGAGG